jgi:alpha-beta hydrolase superfamily lysophospholipase
MSALPRFAAVRRWFVDRPRRIAAGCILAAFLLTNVLAYFHARAMTTFSVTGRRTTPPEWLSTFEKAGVLLTGVNLPRPANEQTPAEFGLEYETCSVRGDDGIDLEAWRIGCRESRALVLMFHGYSACKGTLLPEARALRDLGCETVLVDFRGSGGSSGNDTTLGVYEADDVLKVMEFARPLAGGRPLILYGRSMGGAAILRAIAVHRLEPDGVIVECPFDRLVTTVGNRFSVMGVPAFPMAQLLVFWGGVQHSMNGFAHNPADYAASVRCPTLIMHGSLDPRVSLTEVQSVHANLAGEKQLTLFPRAAHESYLAVDPELWNDTVGEFVARFDPASK